MKPTPATLREQARSARAVWRLAGPAWTRACSLPYGLLRVARV